MLVLKHLAKQFGINPKDGVKSTKCSRVYNNMSQVFNFEHDNSAMVPQCFRDNTVWNVLSTKRRPKVSIFSGLWSAIVWLAQSLCLQNA